VKGFAECFHFFWLKKMMPSSIGTICFSSEVETLYAPFLLAFRT
jgi:hypothetical protein